jgi:hypothetical protein
LQVAAGRHFDEELGGVFVRRHVSILTLRPHAGMMPVISQSILPGTCWHSPLSRLYSLSRTHKARQVLFAAKKHKKHKR